MATFTNQATISYNGITANSNIVTGEITQVLGLTKNATVDSYREGDVLTYVLTIQNSGATPFTGLTVTDDLGAYTLGTQSYVPLTYTGEPVLYYINGVLQTAPAVTAGPPLAITGLSVPAGQSSTVIYRVRVNEFAPELTGGEINNTATLSGGGLTTPLDATETVTVDTAPALTITKAVSPSTVVENGLLTYTFTITNTGAEEADAAAAVIVSDTFNPILSGLTVTLDGAALPTSAYSYDEGTGVFSTAAGQITVPAATYTQNPDTGVWTAVPGVTTLTVTGTV